MKKESLEQRVLTLLSSLPFQQLKAFYNQTTLFNVIGAERNENRHSAFLRWLFSPDSSHGLGTEPLKLFLRLVATLNWGQQTFGEVLYKKVLAGNFEIEQDHLHPWNRYEQMPNDFKVNKENKKLYNSVVNLQLLQKEPNIQKSDIPLEEWVDNQTKGFDTTSRQAFLEGHLIPDVSLQEKDVTEFFKTRLQLLIDKLKERLR